MNPSLENQPQPEVTSSPENDALGPDHVAERGAVASPENKPQAISVSASSQAAQTMAQPSQAITTSIADDSLTSKPATATDSSESDRIEKEWVDKAKAVIQQTRDDPYEQKKEMSKVKADYIQKRFNKTLRLDDAVAK